ncbi:MAG: carbohydrate kinase [Marmoricola sp.]|nr:carbohydrate kinase [Marmoricola sp.]
MTSGGGPAAGRVVRVVAVDLGATSGRVMVARVSVDPDLLELDEVHRFPNGAVRHQDGALRWDIARIRREVLVGLGLAAASGPVDGIGIDSWAIDYGLLDASGELLGDPFSHRDARTDGVLERVTAEIGERVLYAETGLQQLPFNTLYQLVADDSLDSASTLLLIPDLLGFWLTGEVGAERTNASTTQLYGACSHAWSTGLLEQLDLPTALLPPLRDPGDVVGTLLPEVAAATGLDTVVPVIAVGSHDTASAVVGVPAADDRFAYVSSGTWSLVGLELPAPVLTDAAREADFTNEAGVDGTVRLLKNVTGLWVLSECLRQWADDGVPDTDLTSVLRGAAALPAGRAVIDINDRRLLAPDGMPARVLSLVAEAGLPVPDSPASVARLVLDSLALAYRRCVRTASALAGIDPTVVHVVGGGSENALLCQLTADACGLPVVAGPKEAAALGNVLVQARALGIDLPAVADMRALLRRTQSLTRFEPDVDADWDRVEASLGGRRDVQSDSDPGSGDPGLGELGRCE